MHAETRLYSPEVHGTITDTKEGGKSLKVHARKSGEVSISVLAGTRVTLTEWEVPLHHSGVTGTWADCLMPPFSQQSHGDKKKSSSMVTGLNVVKIVPGAGNTVHMKCLLR